MTRTSLHRRHYLKLGLAAAITGLLASALAFSLKLLTEYVQEKNVHYWSTHAPWAFLILPSIGITAIYFLRKHLFLNRKNKGITEIYKTLDQRKEHLPFFKIPSHYLNGFLTVAFGGSTGIEVSTVVASGTIGNSMYKQEFAARMYKRELVCAGVCAGVATLFGSPLAGWLFAVEVIARKWNRTILISCTAAALVAWAMLGIIDPEPLIAVPTTGWRWVALPFMFLLSLLCAVMSVYFTAIVIRAKKLFAAIPNNFLRVNLGALLVGGLICCFPYLYGDSYQGVRELVDDPHKLPLYALALLVLLKPVASSLTLGAGGDGGVFAPSIVMGALLGLVFSLICNTYLGTELIVLNFMLVGAAAALAAAIHAPFTALFLVCNLIPNGYSLFLPLLISSISATMLAKRILPYNVYTYTPIGAG